MVDITLPDGRIAEFPDDMPHSEIEAVLRKQFPMKSKPKQENQQFGYERGGFGGIASDIAESAVSAPGAAAKALLGIPEQLENLGQYRLEHGILPTLGQSALGVGEMVAKLASVPQIGARYLGRKFAPQSSFTKSLQRTQTPFELMRDIESDFGISPTSVGEEEARGVGELFSGGAGLSALKGAIPRIGAVSAESAGGGGDPVHAALGAALGERLLNRAPKAIESYKEQKNLKPRLEEAEKQLKESELSLEQAQIETGADKPKAIKRKILETTEKLDDLQNRAQEYGGDVDVLEIENGIENHQKNISNIENEINRRLGEGLTHNERIGKIIYENQNKIENDINKEFKDIHSDLKSMEMPIESNEEMVALEKDLRKISPNVSDSQFKDMLDKVANQLGIANKGSTITVDNLVKQWRSIRDRGYNLITESKYERDALQRDKLYNDGKVALEEADKLKSLMKENMPEDHYKRLMENNERFKEQVVPLRTSSTWREIEKNKKIKGKDLIEKLGGEDPANVILRKHILNDPKASDLMLGSRMAGKPALWNKYHEASEPYLNSATKETRDLIKHHDMAKKQLEDTNRILSKAMPDYENRKNVSKEIEKHSKELEKQKKNLKRLNEEIKKYGASKERFRKLKEIEDNKNKIKKKSLELLKKASVYAAGGEILKKIMKILMS